MPCNSREVIIRISYPGSFKKKKKKECRQRIKAQELPLPRCRSGCGQGTGSICPGMKDGFCSSALPCDCQPWGPMRASFPGSITGARARTREQGGHSGACVWAPACPRGTHLRVPGATQRRGGLNPTLALQLHAGQRCCKCCLRFACHQGRAYKRHHLSVNVPRVNLEPIAARGALLRQR